MFANNPCDNTSSCLVSSDDKTVCLDSHNSAPSSHHKPAPAVSSAIGIGIGVLFVVLIAAVATVRYLKTRSDVRTNDFQLCSDSTTSRTPSVVSLAGRRPIYDDETDLTVVSGHAPLAESNDRHNHIIELSVDQDATR
jgi:hypothetical protein